MPQPLDPTGTFGETPRKESLADGPDPTHPDHAAPARWSFWRRSPAAAWARS